MAKSLAVLGTGSDVGKSLMATAFCRMFARAGVRVAPFKAQNMSLNSFVTIEGGEMGRAQVLQAQACGLVPHVDMNPILLKPETDGRSQVIVRGKVWASHRAREYFDWKHELFEHVTRSFRRLAQQFDMVVIEGAGSAAEVNLRDRDIVNWPVVELADAAVVLVADIDRGGVFAQVIGTLDLLAPEERQRVIGIVINKFRGDVTLFDDGIRFLEERTRVPVLGVIPFLRHLDLDQEDSLGIDRIAQPPFQPDKVNIAVVLVPHLSNFTDFNALAAEEDVIVRYVDNPDQLQGADVVILPGSKTTIADLRDLANRGFVAAIQACPRRGIEVVGICGGYQMLGEEVSDPQDVESGGTVPGLGLLGIVTELKPAKRTVQVQGIPLFSEAFSGTVVTGYEIHMGATTRKFGRPCFRLIEGPTALIEEGTCREDGMVWGTYLHGVFDAPAFRRRWLNAVRARKRLPLVNEQVSESVSKRLAGALDSWTDHVQSHLDLTPVWSALKL
ncbi:MAG: cobyric acid synthase [Nitrospirae bacterium]|nr:MAG: cobyric acid synthase [Nitrospirota bacterium]